jgi:hypothetical protein
MASHDRQWFTGTPLNRRCLVAMASIVKKNVSHIHLCFGVSEWIGWPGVGARTHHAPIRAGQNDTTRGGPMKPAYERVLLIE